MEHDFFFSKYFMGPASKRVTNDKVVILTDIIPTFLKAYPFDRKYSENSNMTAEHNKSNETMNHHHSPTRHLN